MDKQLNNNELLLMFLHTHPHTHPHAHLHPRAHLKGSNPSKLAPRGSRALKDPQLVKESCRNSRCIIANVRSKFVCLGWGEACHFLQDFNTFNS